MTGGNKWLVIADKNGQLGNRLVLFTNFLGNAIEKKYGICNPYFDEFREYFECAKNNQYDDLRIRTRFVKSQKLNALLSKILTKTTGLLFRILKVTPFYRVLRIYDQHDKNWKEYSFYNLEGPEFEKALDRKIIIVQGWSFRSWNLVQKHAEKIRPLFQPSEPYKSKIAEHLKSNRKNTELLIGVHIRKGDYKTFADGAYYYENEDYLKWMKQVNENIFPNKKIRYMICSNEKLSPELFPGLDVCFGPGHFIEDLFCLAGCDYLMGPPSTFSQWASFYGNVPLAILTSKNILLQEKEFYYRKTL